MRTPATLLLVLLALTTLAGCLYTEEKPADTYARRGFSGDDTAGAYPSRWPNLDGETVRVYDNGLLAALGGDVESRFHNLTGGTVQVVGGVKDSGAALAALMDAHAKGKEPPVDVVVGLDRARLGKAAREGVLQPYTPLMAHHVLGAYSFPTRVDNRTVAWDATPIAHEYVALVVDKRSAELRNVSAPRLPFPVLSLYAAREYPDQIVVPDPTKSGRGLAFMLATIATFGEGGPQDYSWTMYWRDLLAGADRDFDHAREGPITTADDWWSTYGHFNASAEGGDYPVVLGRSTTPAIEYGADLAGNRSRFQGDDGLAPVAILTPEASYHLIDHVAIANGTTRLAAAQAFVEFTLTDLFQGMLFERLGIQGVTASQAGGPDELCLQLAHEDACALLKTPGQDFLVAALEQDEVDRKLDYWLCQWEKVHGGSTPNAAEADCRPKLPIV